MNNDLMPHTVISSFLKSGLIYPSGSNQGPSEFNYTFSNKGIYTYYCKIHPWMQAIITASPKEKQS